MSRRARFGLFFVFAVGMLLALVPVQESIHQARPLVFDADRKSRGTSFISVGPTPAVIAAMGGFRTLAADLLWLKVEDVWHGGSWWTLEPLLEAVTQLDPNFDLAWRVYGWHCAYNLHGESRTDVDRNYWLKKGVDILHRAVEANPDSWEVTWELGWTYFDRVHDLHQAAEWFYRADHLKGAPAYVSRLYYRAYEHALDFDKLFPAMAYAQTRHPEAKAHQVVVTRDRKYWRTHKDDKQAHAKVIRDENTARHQRGIRPFFLYPNDPFFDVCPECGLPSPKGSGDCSVCGYPLASQAPATSGAERRS